MPRIKKRIALGLKVSGDELAEIWGVNPRSISAMKQNGTAVPDGNNLYDLAKETKAYIQRLKDRRPTGDVETETAYWKLQNVKQKNRDWRMSRDRQVGTEMLKQLAAAIQTLKQAVSGHADVVAALDSAIEAVGCVDVDAASMAIEGGMDEDDEQ